MRKTGEERLLAGKVISGEHWRWKGATNSDGYGEIYYKGKRTSVHRVSAYLHLGLDISNPEQLALHKPGCPFKDCWNPDHLYIGNACDNMKDKSKLRTHCPQGHEYTKENSYITKTITGTRRQCNTCLKIRRDEWNEKMKKRRSIDYD